MRPDHLRHLLQLFSTFAEERGVVLNQQKEITEINKKDYDYILRLRK